MKYYWTEDINMAERIAEDRQQYDIAMFYQKIRHMKTDTKNPEFWN